VHIQPGKPTQNARVESFHGRLSEERLRVSWFCTPFDACKQIAIWRQEYNEQRPHSSLKYLTPTAFAAPGIRGKDADSGSLKNDNAVFHFPAATTAVG